MKKFYAILTAILLACQVNAQSLLDDTLRGPIKSFYKGCLAINNYLVNNNLADIEDAMTLLNPRKTQVSVFTFDSIDIDALINRGEHVYYDYTYAKYLYEHSDVAYIDKGLERGMGACYVETLTVKANSTVKFSFEVLGGEPFYMFALCEPTGSVTLSIERKSDAVKIVGDAYEKGTVSYLSCDIPNSDILIVTLSNTSDNDESIVIASN